MAQDCAASVEALALRVAKLASSGAPLPGAGNLYVTEGIIQLTATPEVKTGTSLEQENGAGIACVRFKKKDTILRYNLTLAICAPEFELFELLIGGEADSTGGYVFPELGTVEQPDGVSLELWSHAIIDGEPADPNPYFQWGYQRCHFQPGKEITLDSGIQAQSFTGYFEQNPNWLDGPGNDWGVKDTTKGPVVQRVSTFPSGVCGATALAAS